MKDFMIFLLLLLIGLGGLYIFRDNWWFDPRTPLPQETENEHTQNIKPTTSNTISSSTFGLPPEQKIDTATSTVNHPEQEVATPEPSPHLDITPDDTQYTDLNTDIIIDDADTTHSNTEEENGDTPQNPTDFIQNYYNQLKNAPYEDTWDMLSPDFQAQSSFDKYVRWWSRSVDTVSVEEVTTLSGNRVSVVLNYRMKNGKKVCSEDTFTLEAVGNSWQIDKQKYKNC